MSKIHIILEIQDGICEDPEAFHKEENAGKYFESCVTAKEVDFRPRNEGETWDQYAAAFDEHVGTEECIYEPMDYEIHWWTTELNP